MIENLGGGGDGIELPETWERESKENFVDDKKNCLKYTGNMLKSIQTGKKRRKLTKTQAI